MTTVHALTSEQHATVLAALRHYQAALTMNGGAPPQDTADIATNCDTIEPLLEEAIDDLVDTLSHSLKFGEIVNLLGTDSDPYALAGSDMSAEGAQEVDLPTIVSHGDGGAYVMGWLWVPDSALAEEDLG